MNKRELCALLARCIRECEGDRERLLPMLIGGLSFHADEGDADCRRLADELIKAFAPSMANHRMVAA